MYYVDAHSISNIKKFIVLSLSFSSFKRTISAKVDRVTYSLHTSQYKKIKQTNKQTHTSYIGVLISN